ncbi:S-layer homology domain-containing protein [Cohnella massiliensis]
MGKGILKGLGDGRFAPRAPTSRAESIQAIRGAVGA